MTGIEIFTFVIYLTGLLLIGYSSYKSGKQNQKKLTMKKLVEISGKLKEESHIAREKVLAPDVSEAELESLKRQSDQRLGKVYAMDEIADFLIED